MDTTNNAYAQAGVDVDVEAKASAIMYEACKQTYDNRKGKIGEIKTLFDHFAGKRTVRIHGLSDGSCMYFNADGAGSMVEVAQRMEDYSTIGHHLIAMLADDVPPQGGEAALVLNILDVKSLGQDERHLPKIAQLAEGLVEAAKLAGVAVVNGEIAQMGTLVSGYGDFPFNWSGGCIWFGKENRLFSGTEIEPKDVIVLLQEKGPRTNGISLLRKMFSDLYGPVWHQQPFNEDTLGGAVMTKPTIYSPLCYKLHGGFAGAPLCKVHAFVHVTGGGLPEKLGRALKASGFGAILRDVFEPPAIVRHCQELSLTNQIANPQSITDRDAYKTWNMGQGYAIIAPQWSLNTIMDEANRLGIEAKEAGFVTRSPGIRIYSRGLEKPSEWLHY